MIELGPNLLGTIVFELFTVKVRGGQDRTRTKMTALHPSGWKTALQAIALRPQRNGIKTEDTLFLPIGLATHLT